MIYSVLLFTESKFSVLIPIFQSHMSTQAGHRPCIRSYLSMIAAPRKDIVPGPSVLLSEVDTEPNLKLECVSKFHYLGDTLSAGEGVEKAAS